MAGTCSSVDQMNVTAMPRIATSAMAENHIKTDSIELQLQVECWYEQEELTTQNSLMLGIKGKNNDNYEPDAIACRHCKIHHVLVEVQVTTGP